MHIVMGGDTPPFACVHLCCKVMLVQSGLTINTVLYTTIYDQTLDREVFDTARKQEHVHNEPTHDFFTWNIPGRFEWGAYYPI
jgi:deoxycytidylate deaminase